jgi:chemotaxis protein methyltransferase CheR
VDAGGTPVNDADFQVVRRVVRERSGIALEAGKAYLADARLGPLARDLGLGTPEALVARLRSPDANGLRRKVAEAMAVTETSFFRDALPFEALRSSILPGILARRAAERTLTVWSAACSSGQEIYSVAMLLREAFAGLPGWRVRLIASDLSGEMLRRAREGAYTQLEVNRGLPAGLLVKYFEKRGLEWRIRAELPASVEFREINLVEPWPELPPMDLVFLRNVLLYFEEGDKRSILARARRLLGTDGLLVLGSAETTYTLDDDYELVQAGRTMFYRPSRDRRIPT